MTGILLVDKPQDWTSSDVVAKLRNVLHEKKIGHAGTLDPLATGLLIVLIGRATRASDYVMAHDKEYIATLRTGIETDTQDITGKILNETGGIITAEELKGVLPIFKGDILQIPPMYSAIKVKGKKLYEIARKGLEVERSPRSIKIYDISVTDHEGNDFTFDIKCSSGTYIRTLCHDIGKKLGCGGCMAALRRVKVGDFSIEDSHTLDEIRKAALEGRVEELLLPVDTAFSSFPKFTVSNAQEIRIRNGNSVKTALNDGEYRVYSSSGEFLMAASSRDGEMKTIKSFFEIG